MHALSFYVPLYTVLHKNFFIKGTSRSRPELSLKRILTTSKPSSAPRLFSRQVNCRNFTDTSTCICTVLCKNNIPAILYGDRVNRHRILWNLVHPMAYTRNWIIQNIRSLHIEAVQIRKITITFFCFWRFSRLFIDIFRLSCFLIP